MPIVLQLGGLLCFVNQRLARRIEILRPPFPISEQQAIGALSLAPYSHILDNIKDIIER
jgi:hypothetical protein